MKTREELITPLVKNNRVLDLGNSWGDFKDLLKQHAKSYHGLDIEKGTDFQQDLNVPFDLKKKFDVIVAGELIEHVENTAIFLDNVHRHLAPKGIFFLSTPNPTSFRFFLYLFLNKEPEFEGHIQYFTHDALALVLKNHFHIKKVGFTNNLTNNEGRGTLSWQIKFSIENGIGTIIPRLAPHLYAICGK